MKGITIAIRMVMMVVIFIAVALILWNVFGAPDCRAMANVTSEQLRMGFNEVGDSNFPYYDGAGIPSDPNIYVEKQIVLCQSGTTYAYFQQFMGGMPEYQIYYETFPEGFFNDGAWMWTENYPWSGGAASSMFFWGAMRVGTVAFRGARYILSARTIMGLSAGETMMKLFRERSAFLKQLKNEAAAKKLLTSNPGLYSAFKNKKSAKVFIQTIGELDADNMITKMVDSGWYKKGPDGFAMVNPTTGKIILSDERQVVKISINRVVGEGENAFVEPIEQIIYVKRNSAGEIVETAFGSSISDVGSGFEQLTIIPSEAMKTYIDDLGDATQANILKNIYEYGDTPTTWQSIKNFGIQNTKIYQQVYDATGPGTRLKIFLETAGSTHTLGASVVDVTQTAALKNSILELALENDDFYQRFIRQSIKNDPGIWQKFKSRFSISAIDQLEIRHINQFIEEMPSAGMWILPKESSYNLDRIVVDYIENNADAYFNDFASDGIATATRRTILDRMKDSTDNYYLEYFEQMSDEQFDVVFNRVTDQISGQEIALRQIDQITFETEVNKAFFRTTTDALQAGDEVAEKELGLMLGFLTQDTDLMPRSLGRTYADRQVHKMLYIEGTAMVNPNSWIYKQFIGEAMTENCEGNSVCLYTHAIQDENPHYMEEYVDDFMIRIWRPVSFIEQAAGPQAIMMHVPEHPRFYLVSPCYAKARIWKTKYKNEDTIFVSLIKCPLDMDGDGVSDISNYCYADEKLIKNYVKIWAGSDFADITLTIVTAGGSKVATKIPKLVSELAGRTLDFDPVTLTQGAAEALIAWPGWPFKDLTYDKVVEGSSTCEYGELQNELESLRGD